MTNVVGLPIKNRWEVRIITWDHEVADGVVRGADHFGFAKSLGDAIHLGESARQLSCQGYVLIDCREQEEPVVVLFGRYLP